MRRVDFFFERKKLLCRASGQSICDVTDCHKEDDDVMSHCLASTYNIYEHMIYRMK